MQLPSWQKPCAPHSTWKQRSGLQNAHSSFSLQAQLQSNPKLVRHCSHEAPLCRQSEHVSPPKSELGSSLHWSATQAQLQSKPKTFAHRAQLAPLAMQPEHTSPL